MSSTFASDDTVIGPQVVYFIKEDIQNSGRYLLSTNPNQNEFEINIVTLTTDVANGTENTIAFSDAFFNHFASASHPDYFIENGVGTCGSEKASACATTVVATFVNLIDSMNAGTTN